MQKILSFFQSALSEKSGISSRRLTLFVLIALFILVVIIDLFTHHALSEHVFDWICYLILGCLGTLSSKDFANSIGKNRKKDAEQHTNSTI